MGNRHIRLAKVIVNTRDRHRAVRGSAGTVLEQLAGTAKDQHESRPAGGRSSIEVSTKAIIEPTIETVGFR